MIKSEVVLKYVLKCVYTYIIRGIFGNEATYFSGLKFPCLANPRSECCLRFGGFCEIFGVAVRKRFSAV